MKKAQVAIGTIWQDRGNEKFEVAGINKKIGVIQISAVGNGNGDGYKTMTESSLRNNYKLLAISDKELEPVTVPTPGPTTGLNQPVGDDPQDNMQPTQGKQGHAADSRVMCVWWGRIIGS